MRLAMRNVFSDGGGGGDLPPGATAVQYLEGVDGACIIIPWVMSTSDRIEMDAQFTAIVNNNAYNGAFYGGSIERLDFAAAEVGTGKFRINYGPGNDLRTADTDRHLFVLDAKRNLCKIDDTMYSLPGTHVAVPANRGYIGVLGRLLVDNLPPKHNISAKGCRCFSLRFYRDDVLQLDLWPIRLDSVGCLYDRISRETYGNAFSGSLIVGPDGGGGYKRKCVRRSHRRSARPSYPPLVGGRNPWGRDQAERSESRARFCLRFTPHLWKEAA